MLALDFVLEGVILVLSSLALLFVARSRNALTLKAVGRARLFLFFVILVALIENGVGIFLGFRRETDTITLEAVTLALTCTAFYYSGRAKTERPRENLGVAVVCMVWTVMASVFELGLGFILR
ncbi:MAG: hypothetical protein ACE5IC_10710 [Candidatus Brocadiales bacterium]